jgi:hypothetical protein
MWSTNEALAVVKLGIAGVVSVVFGKTHSELAGRSCDVYITPLFLPHRSLKGFA